MDQVIKRAEHVGSHSKEWQDTVLEDSNCLTQLKHRIFLEHSLEIPQAFLRLVRNRKLRPQHYWHIVRIIWLRSQIITPDSKLWEQIFENQYQSRHHLMSSQEFAELQQFPSELRIFRGCLQIAKNGFSWSVSEEVAASYPQNPSSRSRYHFRRAAKVFIEARVKKENIIGYIDARAEKEIVVLPQFIEIVREVLK